MAEPLRQHAWQALRKDNFLQILLLGLVALSFATHTPLPAYSGLVD